MLSGAQIKIDRIEESTDQFDHPGSPHMDDQTQIYRKILICGLPDAICYAQYLINLRWVCLFDICHVNYTVLLCQNVFFRLTFWLCFLTLKLLSVAVSVLWELLIDRDLTVNGSVVICYHTKLKNTVHTTPFDFWIVSRFLLWVLFVHEQWLSIMLS